MFLCKIFQPGLAGYLGLVVTVAVIWDQVSAQFKEEEEFVEI